MVKYPRLDKATELGIINSLRPSPKALISYLKIFSLHSQMIHLTVVRGAKGSLAPDRGAPETRAS